MLLVRAMDSPVQVGQFLPFIPNLLNFLVQHRGSEAGLIVLLGIRVRPSTQRLDALHADPRDAESLTVGVPQECLGWLLRASQRVVKGQSVSYPIGQQDD